MEVRGNSITRDFDVTNGEKTYYAGWFDTTTQALMPAGWSIMDGDTGEELKEGEEFDKITKLCGENFFKDLGKILPAEIPKELLEKKLKELI